MVSVSAMMMALLLVKNKNAALMGGEKILGRIGELRSVTSSPPLSFFELFLGLAFLSFRWESRKLYVHFWFFTLAIESKGLFACR